MEQEKKEQKHKDKRAEQNNIVINELTGVQRKIDGINSASLDFFCH